MNDEDDANEEVSADDGSCPFCASTEDCEHLLLQVDLTFGTCTGGPLFDAFGDRWRTIADRDDNDFDEPASFDELLDEVDSLSDASSDLWSKAALG